MGKKFDMVVFQNLENRELGFEYLKEFNSKELKQIAKDYNILVKEGKRDQIAEKIVEMVIGFKIRQNALSEVEW